MGQALLPLSVRLVQPKRLAEIAVRERQVRLRLVGGFRVSGFGLWA